MSASSSPSQPSPEYLAENNGGPLLATAVAFIVLQIVFVTLRFAARWLKKRPIDLDDYFIVSALLFCLGLNATSIGTYHFEPDNHLVLSSCRCVSFQDVAADLICS